MPLISIITPCRNSGDRLAATLDAIRSQKGVLDGSLQLQHIVVDGNSTDCTHEVIEQNQHPFLTVISERDTGMYDALAKGLRMAKGDIIGYLNAGDLLLPGALEVLVDIFAQPDVDWVTGYSTHVNDKSQITGSWPPFRYRREFILNGFYATPTYPVCIQQESTFWSQRLNQSIPWARLREFRLAGDYFLWTEFAKQAELHSVMSILGAFRIHAGQLSEASDQYQAEVQSMIRPSTPKERFTASWESLSSPFLKGLLWNRTLKKSPAHIFHYDHQTQCWTAK